MLLGTVTVQQLLLYWRSQVLNFNDALMSLTPTAQWALKDVTKYSTLSWFSPEIAKPTEAELQAEIARLEAEQPFKACKDNAKKLIAASDWSVLPDVGISNGAEFVAYRAELRELIKNPVANPVFPTEPQPVWA